MEEKWNARTALLIGNENVEKLSKTKIIVYGIGGVGSFAVEGLIRAGVENIVIVDNDVISPSNLNRQIHATIPNIGKLKIECMKERILSINPNVKVEAYIPDDIQGGEETLIDNTITYVVDAVDTVTTKLRLIKRAKEQNIPISSCMGTGNKLDPTKLKVADIYKTNTCPLAKIIRKNLKKYNIKKQKVVFSEEVPTKNESKNIGSISFVPSVAGLILASQVVNDIIENVD